MQVKTKNLVVGALVVLLVGMLWYRVVYSPMQSKASKAKTAAHDADTQSTNLRQTLKATGDAGKKTAKSASNESLLAALPADPAQASFFRALDALRTSSGADWQTVSPSVPTPSGTYSSITVAITVSGTEDQIDRYLAGLASMSRVFVVDNLSIGPGGSTAAAGPVATQGPPGVAFVGGLEQAAISGRIFTSSAGAASTTTGATGAAATPTTGAPAPTGAGAPAGTVNG